MFSYVSYASLIPVKVCGLLKCKRIRYCHTDFVKKKMTWFKKMPSCSPLPTLSLMTPWIFTLVSLGFQFWNKAVCGERLISNGSSDNCRSDIYFMTGF